jgi:hypothetical protein
MEKWATRDCRANKKIARRPGNAPGTFRYIQRIVTNQ